MTPVRHCKLRVRQIDQELETLNHRNPAQLPRFRKLLDDRMVYADILEAAGVPTPPPAVTW